MAQHCSSCGARSVADEEGKCMICSRPFRDSSPRSNPGAKTPSKEAPASGLPTTTTSVVEKIDIKTPRFVPREIKMKDETPQCEASSRHGGGRCPMRGKFSRQGHNVCGHHLKGRVNYSYTSSSTSSETPSALLANPPANNRLNGIKPEDYYQVITGEDFNGLTGDDFDKVWAALGIIVANRAHKLTISKRDELKGGK